MKNHTKFKDLFSETQIHADFRRLFSFAPLFSFKSTGKRPIFLYLCAPKTDAGTQIHAIRPYMNKKYNLRKSA